MQILVLQTTDLMKNYLWFLKLFGMVLLEPNCNLPVWKVRQPGKLARNSNRETIQWRIHAGISHTAFGFNQALL